jgi:hypothetical protein
MASDDLLLKWVTPDETATEFLVRQFREAVSTGLPFVDKHVKLRPGHVLEIIGPAGTAKTEMLTEVRLVAYVTVRSRCLAAGSVLIALAFADRGKHHDQGSSSNSSRRSRKFIWGARFVG